MNEVVTKLLDALGIPSIDTRDRESTQDFVNVEAIEDGVVVLKENGKPRYIKILEVVPVNMALLPDGDQMALLNRYETWLRGAPLSFQIKIITQIPDLETYIKSAKDASRKEDDEDCRSLIERYIKSLYQEARNGIGYVKRFFFIFSYQEDSLSLISAKTARDKINELNQIATHLTSTFRNVDIRIVDPINPDGETAKNIYEYYNRPLLDDEPFRSRVERIRHDVTLINGDHDPEFDIKDILASKSIGLMERNYMTVDGDYRSYFYVDGQSYPDSMTIYGWLYELINKGFGIDVDIFYEKQDAREYIDKLRMRNKFTKQKLRERDSDSRDADEIADAVYGNTYLIEAVQRGKQNLYEMAVLITVHAGSFDELTEKKRALVRDMRIQDVKLVECQAMQEEAFLMAGFSNRPGARIFRRAKHIVTQKAVVAAFPYIALQLTDSNGIYLGRDMLTSNLVFYDLFNRENYNLIILGETGFGKTMTLLTILYRLRYQGKQCFVISPQKQHEFQRVCPAIGGQFIDMSASSSTRINIFDIYPRVKTPEELATGVANSWRTEKIDVLRKWLKYLLKEAPSGEIAQLETILVDLYEKFGITEDNDSVYRDKGKGKLKDMPIFSDFYDLVERDGSIGLNTKRILNKFVAGNGKALNGRTNVELNNNFIVFGIENIQEDLRAATFYITLEYIWARARYDTKKEKVIAIDEGWSLVDGTDEDVANSVSTMFKLARGLNCGVVFATQTIIDLRGSRGKSILGAAYTKMILHIDNSNLPYTIESLRLTPLEQEMVSKQDRGEVLMLMGDNHIQLNIKPNEMEYRLFTTNPRERAAIENS